MANCYGYSLYEKLQLRKKNSELTNFCKDNSGNTLMRDLFVSLFSV